MELVDEADPDRWRRALVRGGARALVVAPAPALLALSDGAGGQALWFVAGLAAATWALTQVEAWGQRHGGPWAAVVATWLAALVVVPVAALHVAALEEGGPLGRSGAERVGLLVAGWKAAPVRALLADALIASIVAFGLAIRHARRLARTAADVTRVVPLGCLAFSCGAVGLAVVCALSGGAWAVFTVGTFGLLLGALLTLGDLAEHLVWRARHTGRVGALARRLARHETTPCRVRILAHLGRADARLFRGGDVRGPDRAPRAWLRELARISAQAVLRAAVAVAARALEEGRAGLASARPPLAEIGGAERIREAFAAIEAWRRAHDEVLEVAPLDCAREGHLGAATDALADALEAAGAVSTWPGPQHARAALRHARIALDARRSTLGAERVADAVAAAVVVLASCPGRCAVLDAIRADLAAWIEALDARSPALGPGA